MPEVEVGSVKFGNHLPFVLIAGPCLAESVQLCVDVAGKLQEACAKNKIPYVFKASWEKANRTHVDSPSCGVAKGLLEVKKTGIPVTTDVHEPEDPGTLLDIDLLQIPAMLMRQTRLIQSASNIAPINIKKMQSASVDDLIAAHNKRTRNKAIVTERGTFFGYDNLVVDFRNLVKLKHVGIPTVFDATHSVRQKNQHVVNNINSFALASSALAIGIAGLFFETHPRPREALSDGDTQIPLNTLIGWLPRLQELDSFIKSGHYVNFPQDPLPNTF